MDWINFNIVDWVEVDEYLDWNTLTETQRRAIRGFPEYIVPDGSILLAEDGTELKSKFLRGEYFLKPLASAVGNNIYSTNPAGLDDQQPSVYDPLLLVQLLKQDSLTMEILVLIMEKLSVPFPSNIFAWRSLVAHLTGGQVVAG